MWSTVGGIIQVLTIVVAGTFGVLGTLSKREPGSTLKRSDKLALGGIIVASLLALTAFSVDRIRKQQDRDAELRSVATEIERQGTLLLEVQRGQLSIREFNVQVTYILPANHPKLASMVGQWKDYVARAKRSDFDDSGYSKDGRAFVGRDKEGKVSRLAIHDGSDLYPKPLSDERRVMFPPLALQFFRRGTVIDPLAKNAGSAYARKGQDLDLSLFVPLSLTNPVARPQDGAAPPKGILSVRLWYDVEKDTIEVVGNAAAVTAVADTGAITSLLDLPGRQVVLTGLQAADVSDIKSFQLNAITGTGRIWSGQTEIFGKALVKSDVGTFRIASYTLKESDFRGLAARAATNNSPEMLQRTGATTETESH